MSRVFGQCDHYTNKRQQQQTLGKQQQESAAASCNGKMLSLNHKSISMHGSDNVAMVVLDAARASLKEEPSEDTLLLEDMEA